MDFFSSHWFDSFASGTCICTLSVFFLTGTATSEFRRYRELFEMKETAVRRQSLKDDSLSELVAATS